MLASAALAADDGFEALTKPSKDLLLSFNQTGRVMKVPVNEGDTIRTGQLLVQQDNLAEQANLAQLKAQADDVVRIKAGQAQLDQKRLALKNFQHAFSKGAATQTELDQAVLDVTIAELSLQLADLQHKQDQMKYEEVKCQVDRMQLLSPVDGKVERIAIHEGETADPQSKVVRVVCLDPLWIDVDVPLKFCGDLKLGQTAQVLYDDQSKPLAGKIEFIAAVAVSDTLSVRVALPNAELKRAGDRVKVRFPGSENCKPAAATMPAEIPAPK